MFPHDLTSHRPYTFWCAVREEVGLPGLRIQDTHHTYHIWASQNVMNVVGLTVVAPLLGYRKRRTTATSTKTPQDATAQAAIVIAAAMG